LKRGGGRRYYRPVDVELLRAIKRLLYDEGYTIKGVQKMLREQGVQGMSRPEAGPPPAAGPSQRIEPDFGRAAPAPPATRSTAEEPPFEAEPVPSRPAWNLSALRAVLEELREAERILARTRAG
jgi:DNA-binding transcriptional MerR regulator